MCNWKLKQPQKLINLGFLFFTEAAAKFQALNGVSGEICVCLILKLVNPSIYFVL